MVPDLLWIVGAYVAAAIFAHMLIRRSGGPERRHYVLVAGNHQMQIEWHIRALRQFARRSGTEIGVTVVLDQSEDETGRIVERMGRGNSGISLVQRADNGEAGRIRDGGADKLGKDGGWRTANPETESQEAIWVDLARLRDRERLPL